MAKGAAIILKTDGTTERAEFTGIFNEPGGPTLDWLQKMVAGPIEIVPYFNVYLDGAVPHNVVAFCNEEGKIEGLPLNALATMIWAGRGTDAIVGDIVILFGDDDFMASL